MHTPKRYPETHPDQIAGEILTASEAADRVGITYRMLDYWCRQGIIAPSIDAHGSGSRRGFSEGDVLGLAVISLCREFLALDHIGQWFAECNVRAVLEEVKGKRWGAILLRDSSLFPEFTIDPFRLFEIDETVVVVPVARVFDLAGVEAAQ